nr:RNA-directed DNA polymerase, eukaryota, reverse transcriptase zinc-binding domain protein [Tanacetum cinerariifolium]
PKSVLKILERIRRQFFWGSIRDEKKMSWIKWSNVIAPKLNGGLGTGSLKAANLHSFLVGGGKLVRLEIHNMGFHSFKAFSRKECSLSDRCGIDGDNFQWIWDWRRPIRSGREIAKFDELMELLCNFRHGTGEDGWNFLLSNSNLFYVKPMPVAIDKCRLLSAGRPTRWSFLIPSKVLILFGVPEKPSPN